MPSSYSSSSDSDSYRWWRARSKARRQAVLNELNVMREIVVVEIGECEDKLLAANDKLRTYDTLVQEIMEDNKRAEDDDGDEDEDDFSSLQNLTLDEKDAYIAYLEGKVDVALSLIEHQNQQIKGARASVLYHVQAASDLRNWEARRHAEALALAVSEEQRAGEKQKEIALNQQRQELEPIAKIGLNVRNRALEYAFVEDGVTVRESIISKGNRSAHDGDVLADVQLYSDAAEPKRHDAARFQAYYGASLQTVNEMKHCSKFIEMLNWHYNMKTIMAERSFDKKNVDMESFQKGFRFMMRLMVPIGGIRTSWELERNTEAKNEYFNLKNIHDRASLSHQTWWKARKRV
ncbi:hypothetical protein N431DRAFT_477930 [Stipitochalara longipes BDJ]|nr:hypothetical protein N431DRAFT_477930 [Stipitochalara longipes BDJ]